MLTGTIVMPPLEPSVDVADTVVCIEDDLSSLAVVALGSEELDELIERVRVTVSGLDVELCTLVEVSEGAVVWLDDSEFEGTMVVVVRIVLVVNRILVSSEAVTVGAIESVLRVGKGVLAVVWDEKAELLPLSVG